ncbi:MAG: sulfotransferase, partial [Hyphomonas sp.]|nr:sulfotransferase [Hyphomonas sp.]
MPEKKGSPAKRPKLPSFLIVGTMKGGTTALYDHMCTHPRIAGGTAKEIHYFSLYPDRGLDWYADQFRDVPDRKLTLDASPTYFDMCFGRGIPAHIKAAIPKARIFLILRDPVARAISHFEHLKKVVSVPALRDVSADEFFSRDFADALAQQTALDIYLFQVLTFSSYLPRYWTYRSVFSGGEMLVLDNEGLKNDPQTTMRKVYDHAKLDFHADERFGAFRHSTGSTVHQISRKNFRRLAELLYPGYEKICAATGLTYQPMTGPDGDPDPVVARPSDLAVPLEVQPSVVDDTVHVGRNGWLFLTGGTNRPIDYFSPKTTPFTDKVARQWSKLLLRRKAECEAAGARFVHLLAPEKLSVYPEHCTLPLDPTARPGHRLRIRPELADVFIDPVAYLNRAKADSLLYWKTDTHWSYAGCFAAYQLLMAQLGWVADSELMARPFNEGSLTLDLGAKLDPPVKESVRFFRPIRDAVRTFA